MRLHERGRVQEVESNRYDNLVSRTLTRSADPGLLQVSTPLTEKQVKPPPGLSFPSGEPKPSPQLLFLRHHAQAVETARLLFPHGLDDDRQSKLQSQPSPHRHTPSGLRLCPLQKSFHRGSRSINCVIKLSSSCVKYIHICILLSINPIPKLTTGIPIRSNTTCINSLAQVVQRIVTIAHAAVRGVIIHLVRQIERDPLPLLMATKECRFGSLSVPSRMCHQLASSSEVGLIQAATRVGNISRIATSSRDHPPRPTSCNRSCSRVT